MGRVLIYTRLATRVRPDQKKFIDTLANEKGITQGDAVREIVDYFIKHKKK